MSRVRFYFVAFLVVVSLNLFATDSGIDDFCAIVKEAMPLINNERAKLGLQPLEFKNILNKNEINISVGKVYNTFSSLEYTSQDIFESIKDYIHVESYTSAFVFYLDNAYCLCIAVDVMPKEEFNRYVSSWYDKIFEHLDYSATFETEVLRLVNVERTRRGLAPLQMHDDLLITARIKAGEMVKYEYYGHGSPSGLPDEVVKRYYNIGENIAMGQTSPEEVVRDWMNSPGHRANILEPSYVYIGVGYCNDYWVQQFGDENFVY